MKRIPGFPRYRVTKNGYILDPLKLKALPLQYYDRYLCVNLRAEDGTHKTFRVHRLVASAFRKNPLNLPEVDHKDGDKLNNHYKNLKWCSRQSNFDSVKELGLIRKGNNHPGSKLNNDKVLDIRKLYKQGNLGVIALGKQFNVSQGTISQILNYKTWKHLV